MRRFHESRNIVSEAPPFAAGAAPTGPQNHSPVRPIPRPNAEPKDGPSLVQDEFFLCNIRGLGDLPSPGRVCIEIVAEHDTGLVFAKLYPSANASNAVDIVATRVVPFFERRGLAVKRISTPRKRQYCGMIAEHVYETFLAAAHIEHVALERHRNPYHYFCEELYWFLVREFFQPALRRTFVTSTEQLQKELDRFIDAHNGVSVTNTKPAGEPANFPNFSVHP